MSEPRTMVQRVFVWAIALGFGLIALTLVSGAWILLDRTRQTALHAAELALQNAALIVQSVVNRQFLQIDGALASLPSLFAAIATNGTDSDPQSGARLLRGLNFQTFAFRDIIVLRSDGEIWASARQSEWIREVPRLLASVNSAARAGAAAVVGPARNPFTGDWVLLVVRRIVVPGAGMMDAVAEVPLPLLAKQLSAVGEMPGLQVSLERRDGQLLLNQPYDETRIGKPQSVVISQIQANGTVFIVPAALTNNPTIGIARASFYDDVMIALTLDRTIAMTDWTRERDRMIASVMVAVILVLTLAIILIVALRARARAEESIRFVAHHDALTRLPNRVLFRAKLADDLANVRPGENLALLYIDLDQFKAINDTLGHPIGDLLLRDVANRLTEWTRASDSVARLGGDEFAVVQTRIARLTEAADFAERIIAMLDDPFVVLGHKIIIGASIGIAFSPQDGTDPDQLMKRADLALYRAKQDGRGVYRLFQQEMDAKMQTRRALELDLRTALSNGQLEMFYQPLVGLDAKAVIGFEALLRWRHPTRGLIPPDQFIPLSEEMGIIVQIGEWILLTACTAAAGWPGALKVSVNLSPVQFKSTNLVTAVSNALRDSGLPSSRLELEITETVMLQDTTSTLVTLNQFHELGVSIAMDDFGTGYSSLGYLRRFPFDRIKIDQSFVRELGKRPDCDAIVRAVTALSRELHMATTAEGVETLEQLHALALAGCDVVQGYLFSRPVPATEVRDLLRTIPAVDAMLRESTPAIRNLLNQSGRLLPVT